jgi:hypothetical protein
MKLTMLKARFLSIFLCPVVLDTEPGTGTVTCQKSEPESDLYLSKVRTGTVKNSYGSATLLVARQCST